MAKRSKQRLVQDEPKAVKLGDPRREARAVTIGERLISAPESTLPEAMGGGQVTGSQSRAPQERDRGGVVSRPFVSNGEQLAPKPLEKNRELGYPEP